MTCVCPHCKQTFDLLKQSLQETETQKRKGDAVMEVVYEYFSISQELIRCKMKHRELVDARKAASYLLRKYAGYGPMQIARELNRDHSTIIHNLEALEGQMDVNKAVRAQLAELNALVEKKVMPEEEQSEPQNT